MSYNWPPVETRSRAGWGRNVSEGRVKWERKRRDPSAGRTAASIRNGEQDSLAGIQGISLALIAKCRVNKLFYQLGFPGGSVVKNPPAIQEAQVQSLGWEDPLERGMAIHSSILAWRIPWTEEPSGL